MTYSVSSGALNSTHSLTQAEKCAASIYYDFWKFSYLLS